MTLSAANISVTYEGSDEQTLALSDVSLDVDSTEFVTIIGPSGCGKSTLLHCLAGLLPPSKGSVNVNGQKITSPDPNLAAIVFQDHTLLPWMTVLDNATLGLRFAGTTRHERHKRGMEMLELVGLAEWAETYPKELSGGMRSRVSVARALTMDPAILLMDEPFAALDEQTRRSLGSEMATTLTSNGRSVVMVTHSLDEAVIWADRIIVLSPGPGRIVKEIEVPQPRPRQLDFVADPMFGRIRAELFGLLEICCRGRRDKRPNDAKYAGLPVTSATTSTAPGMAAKQGTPGYRRLLFGLRLGVLASIIAAWYYASGPGEVARIILPTPNAVLEEVQWFVTQGVLYRALALTLSEIAAAFLLSCAIGGLIGFWGARTLYRSRVIEPLLIWAYLVPTILLYPLLVFWLGLGMSSKIAYSVLNASFVIAFNTLRAFRSVDKKYILLGAAYGATERQLDTMIKFRVGLPMIVAGLRLGAALTMITVIAAEMLASTGGLGYLISFYAGSYATARTYAIIIVVLIIVIVFQIILRRLLPVEPDR